MPGSLPSIPIESITSRIFLIRGQKVMLDSDLAELYGVETRVFLQAVRRNQERFPSDFAFQIDEEEWSSLRSQFVTSKGRGGRRYLPFVFTEHGAIMAATVLNSPLAVEMSVFVVRAFVKLREMLSANKKLASKIEELERKLGVHDEAIIGLFEALRQLMEPPLEKRKQIGFTTDNEG
ncbi:MAG: ORF6N domain-containing protein [Leptospirales bacterium]